ncbi:rhodanese-like domain-containing protein [Mucilaginibacter pallidiroseus]|uniref:Rhodanese-like domain-containing protein n=1 Tax=Mucilaginibacter pallidiroseus TaxID=2599295 RepID=A0A563UC08_9SPHI|nr:rhodanese-like domain-containing protein [Mucilaginibacter pallidiroseus]TWR28823.1 rhodanese-like domain-containing protein [Mucilaginibacter pallidiroseus]
MNQIDAVQLQQRLNNGNSINLLDVREPMEYLTHNIGGQNIPVGKLQEHISSLAYNKADEIIVICSAGLRSQTGVQILEQNGYTNAVNLKGGLKALQRANNQ